MMDSHLNHLMKYLDSAALVIAVPALISGIWGMNVGGLTGKGYVDLRNVSFEDSFTIPGLTLNKGGILNSVQGYDLDNQGNIYISSQKSPDLEKKRDCKIFCVRMNYSLI